MITGVSCPRHLYHPGGWDRAAFLHSHFSTAMGCVHNAFFVAVVLQVLECSTWSPVHGPQSMVHAPRPMVHAYIYLYMH
jgi:hypothetical protein